MIHYTFHEVSKPALFAEISDWLEKCAHELFSSINEVNYIFCNDDYLLQINREALDHDYYTDIITFDFRENTTDPLEAEIYISLDRVEENAKAFHCTFADELRRVMVHGLLHLSGLEDHTPEEKKIMRAEEDRFLNSI